MITMTEKKGTQRHLVMIKNQNNTVMVIKKTLHEVTLNVKSLGLDLDLMIGIADVVGMIMSTEEEIMTMITETIIAMRNITTTSRGGEITLMTIEDETTPMKIGGENTTTMNKEEEMIMTMLDGILTEKIGDLLIGDFTSVEIGLLMVHNQEETISVVLNYEKGFSTWDLYT